MAVAQDVGRTASQNARPLLSALASALASVSSVQVSENGRDVFQAAVMHILALRPNTGLSGPN